MQVTFEILDSDGTALPDTIAVNMDQPPSPGDQIVLTGPEGSVAYRVRRQSWQIEVRANAVGDVVGHNFQLESDEERVTGRTKRPKPLA